MIRACTSFIAIVFIMSLAATLVGCQQAAQPFIDSGNANINSKNYDQALADFSRAISIDPKSAAAYVGRGRVYNLQNQPDLALGELNKAIEIDPGLANAYFRRAYSYRLKGMADQAIADYTRTIEIQPDMELAYSNRAYTYYYLKKDYQKAIEDYNKAIGLNVNHAGYYDIRGYCYHKLEQYDKALADYNRAIETDNKTASYYGDRGWLYTILKKYDLALADFSKAIELGDQDAQNYVFRGWCLENLKNTDAAIVDFKTALGLVSKTNTNYRSDAYSGLSVCYERKRDYPAAIAAATRIIELADHESSSNYNNRGYLYVLVGDYASAQQDISKAFAILTDNTTPLELMDTRGWYYYKTGDNEKALADLDKALKMNSDPMVYCHRAQVFIATKEYAKALDDLNKSVDLYGENGETFYYRGLVYRVLGQADKAIADF